MTPFRKRTLKWILKVKYSYNFSTKQVKKWDQNVSRDKIFLYLYLGLSASLRTEIWLRPKLGFSG